MRKLYVALFFCFMAASSNEQGAAIVYDPTNGAQLAGVLETIKGLKESTDEWKASSEFLQKIANEGSEVKRLIALLEDMVCATDKLELFAAVDESLALCENKLEFDLTLMKIEGVSEKLNWITTGTILLTQFETIKSLKDLNDQLEDAIRQVNMLNRYMRGNLIRKAKFNWLKDNAYKDHAVLTQFNL